ncbi:MAG: Rne/Rng family ribonuclease [Deltaproteobacteria bacterium]|nr:Rne/Rng family ribonuclease [Deltaproteobacteria bacterium]
MSRTILINAREGDMPHGEVRVAIIENGSLTDFDVDPQWKEKTRGNIYRGVITNVEPALQAAFVDFGAKKQGFLSFSDVAPHAYRPDAPKNARTITEALKRKQHVTVQILKEEIGQKGAALTTYVSLPGRYLVLMPSGEGAHISRKIEDEEERRRIKALAASLDPPENVGLIVRTAGMEQPKAVLARDLKYLLKMWEGIEARFRAATRPTLLHQDHDAILRTLRDYLTPDVTRIIVDTPQAFDTAKEFIAVAMPKQESMLERYDGRRPLFTEFNVETQVEALFSRRAPLPTGGYLIIDQTEALVSIDVNSGKNNREGSQEETAFRTNIEAVTEVARQLKLRDLGGIVVVDLIDMMNPNHRAEVEKRFKEAIKSDKARFKVSPISQHGLLELTRQRIRPALLEGMMTTCPECDGRGRVRALQSEGTHLLRAVADRLAHELASGQSAKVTLDVPVEVAMHLLNDRRPALQALEAQHNAHIRVQAKTHLPAPHYAISLDKDFAPPAVHEPRRPAPITMDEPDAELPGAEAEPAAAVPVAEGGAKKRRRRGRRGKGGEGHAPAPVSSAREMNDDDAFDVAVLPMASAPVEAEALGDDESAFEDHEVPMASDADVEMIDEGAAAEAPSVAAVPPAGKRRRRRRRGGRGGRGGGRGASPTP